MTDDSSVKQSKTAKARSILQRVSSRHDVHNKSANVSQQSLAQQPVSSVVPPVPRMSADIPHDNAHDPLATLPLRSSMERRPVSSSQSTSMEQSVKLFKIFEALRNGDTTAIQNLTKQDPEAKSTIADEQLSGTTVLHVAVQVAEYPVVLSVLASTSPTALNARDRDGNTALHIAAMLGRAQVVDDLLSQSSIDDSVINHQGKTALDLARTPEVFQHLQLKRSKYVEAKVQQVHQLVQSGAYDQLETLLADQRIQSTVDVNNPELATDSQTVETGGSLLHEAARKKDTRLVQILLLNGADPFCRDRKGKLPQNVTKDDRTRAMLKKSPAAAAAQRGVQEKAILGSNGTLNIRSSLDSPAGAKESRELKGYLKKWTNYRGGWQLRWFVLEDGVLSYYQHQEDAGSACRGAINMRIARLDMDPKEKQSFVILGKSSVKYHLKANHQVEAKRWFWALNNAIQWSKDEARDEARKQKQSLDLSRQAHGDDLDRVETSHSLGRSTLGPESALALGTIDPAVRTASSILGDEGSAYEPSVTGDELTRFATHSQHGDDEDDFGEDASSHDHKPANKDAYNVSAQSAKMQLDLLAQVAAALSHERHQNPDMKISHPSIEAALTSYETAVGNLRSLMADLQRISKDHEAYWQHRLDREASVRRIWEDSMAKVAREQEELQDRIGESEEKRKRTKKALREVLEENNLTTSGMQQDSSLSDAVPKSAGDMAETPKSRRTLRTHDISDDDSDADDEFFDAVDAGEVEVKPAMSESPVTARATGVHDNSSDKALDIAKSYKGYEDGVRQRLALDTDDRPKVSLWGVLKSMIGKDMTKMTLPVSFNEPTSLLNRVAEDMEYTSLLDMAAERDDSAERMVYVAAFAASEYASTIGRVAKPFNPLLGETYEYVRPDRGYRFFIEQVSHHPPVGAAYAESAKWAYFGESAVKSKFYGKSFEFNPLGTWFLRLRHGDGPEELYTWKKVTSSVVGIITGNPTVDNYGPMEIKNWTTGETCLLDFKARGWKANSAYQVSGRVNDAKGNTCWSIGGRWNDKIYARRTPGGQEDPSVTKAGSGAEQAILVWQANARPSGVPFNLTPFAVTLNALTETLKPHLPPTDSRLRPDQRAMEDGEYDLAATEKTRLEEKQRATRRRREQEGTEFEPRWFKQGVDATTGEAHWQFTGEYWSQREKVASTQGTWTGLEDIF